MVSESGGGARGPSPALGASYQGSSQNRRAGERAAWWPRVVDAYGDYAVYQTRTERVIPVVLIDLSPVEA
ncbi:MAG TPA: nitroreductase/quinone reductase family protein [Acidimicrobiia bacterium]|nr:nitroreductase/quinone reductase family protein [Acidimicrobiia bacterium]